MPKIDLLLLEDFASLCATRNFSQTAQLRHVSQPAVSRRIQALEHWAGKALIDRATCPWKLTLAGEIFQSYAVQVLEMLEEARAAMRSADVLKQPAQKSACVVTS